MPETRCAIYTRKSAEDGLEQAFNSLHAQRDACAAYVFSQKHQGWQLLDTAYDDGGVSGATLARPALQRLLADVEGGRIDLVLVYKVDRLTRSLADFARIIETFDARNVAFVSITQQLNTTTSMGRLTLNVLLSFAQFERELTGERIRDKIAAARQKGLWMGGNLPLGYDSQDKRLVVNPGEAATVRRIFERYLALGSVARLKAELDANGIVGKSRTARAGQTRGGKPFSRGALYRLLANRVYLGKAVHKGQAFPGEHPPILDPDLFAAVQEQIAAQSHARRHGLRAHAPSLLTGLLLDHHGSPMSPSHAVKNGRRYRYYSSQTHLQERRRPGPATRVPAHDIEALVQAELQALLQDPAALLDLLGDAAADRPDQTARIAAAAELARRWPGLAPCERSAIVRASIARVILRPDQVEIEIIPEALGHRLHIPEPIPPVDHRGQRIVLTVPARLGRTAGETRLVIPGRATAPARPNPVLIRALVRAHASLEQLGSGALPMAARDLTTTIRLACLAPEITQAILDGTQPQNLTLARLRRPLPLAWTEQRQALGFPATATATTAEPDPCP